MTDMTEVNHLSTKQPASGAQMTNDPRDASGARLQQAMQRLGRHPALRKAMMDLLKRAESQLGYSGPVRDDVTGPIVDALHGDDDRYEKTLADGTKFSFLFRTKIARDFLMSNQERPNHVWEPQTTKLLLNLSHGLEGDVVVGTLATKPSWWREPLRKTTPCIALSPTPTKPPCWRAMST
jgi:hypothetical protein